MSRQQRIKEYPALRCPIFTFSDLHACHAHCSSCSLESKCPCTAFCCGCPPCNVWLQVVASHRCTWLDLRAGDIPRDGVERPHRRTSQGKTSGVSPVVGGDGLRECAAAERRGVGWRVRRATTGSVRANRPMATECRHRVDDAGSSVEVYLGWGTCWDEGGGLGGQALSGRCSDRTPSRWRSGVDQGEPVRRSTNIRLLGFR
jgi:hypothetical protein